MKILLTIKEYAKKEGLSEIAVRKRVSSNYNEIIKIGKETYIIEGDTIIQKLKQNVKNKNSQIRELKLKSKINTTSNDERYIKELERQNEKLEAKIEKKNKKIDKLHDQKDTMYEKFLGTIVNQKVIE
ncbi:MAG: hypothetical protein GY932_12215 [Arcobacter sp.]|nr:hypothetical protein [Arcobacter sp.]